MNQISHQLPITRTGPTLETFDTTKLKVFDHRKQSLASVTDYRLQMSQGIEDYFTRSMSNIESEINLISSSDGSLQTLLAKELVTPCITNLKTIIDVNLENAGYAISNCVSDVDGVASTAFRSFYQVADVDERNINLELEVLTFPFIGRNIFTESKELNKRATTLYNSKVKNFSDFLTEISAKLNEVTGIYEEQITILDTCFKSIASEVASTMTALSSMLKTCQKFSQS